MICPSPKFQECVQDECAWWDKYGKSCAVVSLRTAFHFGFKDLIAAVKGETPAKPAKKETPPPPEESAF